MLTAPKPPAAPDAHENQPANAATAIIQNFGHNDCTLFKLSGGPLWVNYTAGSGTSAVFIVPFKGQAVGVSPGEGTYDVPGEGGWLSCVTSGSTTVTLAWGVPD